MVKMAAWSVLGGAAGMKNVGSLIGGQTRQLEFLECRRGDGRYFFPFLRPEIFRFSSSEAKSPVRVVQFTLKFEQCRCELTKTITGPEGLSIQGGTDEAPELTCEFRKFGDGLHAVFILPGWFSATAWNIYLTELTIDGK